MKKKAIGIDLGTSKCCVGVVRDGKVEILENERGNKTTPSYVAFTDTERLVGEDAKDQATLNPANTVFGVKRIIGRKMGDTLLQDAIDKMPYTIMNKNETCIHVSYKGTEEFLLPQQITAMLLGKMKHLAEDHLKSPVEEAVISVPASFSNAQRQATKDAAAIAGLKVLALINEPTAAAIAYQANRKEKYEERIAIVDFGASTLNVAIAAVCKGRVSMEAVSGSTAIGGNDVDEVMMKDVRSKFEDKFGRKLQEIPGMTERLRSSCEKLKRNLSLLPKVQETLDCFGDDDALPVTIKRVDFNDMIPSEVHASLQNCLQRAVQESGISPKNIARVVLVGGSSRIPQFQKWLEEFFSPNLLDKSVNPDEAVAYGASLYAALLSNDNELEELMLKDIVANNFFFSLKGDSTLQPAFGQRSSRTLPARSLFPFNGQSPFNENTRKHTFEFYEELNGQKNPHRLIGTVCLDDEFRQAVRLISDVTLTLDRCGIFNVLVQLKPDHEFDEVVKNYAGKLSTSKLQNAIEREQQFKEEDVDEKERVEALTSLEALCFRLQSMMGSGNRAKAALFPELEEQINAMSVENIEWLDASNHVPKAKCVKRHTKLVKLENEYASKIRQYEQAEKERRVAVTNLESLCTFLETTVGTAVTSETQLVATLREQVKEASEWLKRSERPSKLDCDSRADSLKKVHDEIKKRLEIKRREDERRSAVDDLKIYCTELQAMKFQGDEFNNLQYRVRSLKEETAKCSKYLDGTEFPSLAECNSRKRSLEKEFHEITRDAERRRATQLENERCAARSKLRLRCNELEKLASRFHTGDTEGHALASLALSEARDTRRWVTGEPITTEECGERIAVIEDFQKTLNEYIQEVTQKQLAEREKEYRDCCKEAALRWEYADKTLMIDLSRKKEPKLCQDILKNRDALFKSLENPTNFKKENYDKNLATFETSVGTLKNKMKRHNK